jgi:hypothetical protein
LEARAIDAPFYSVIMPRIVPRRMMVRLAPAASPHPRMEVIVDVREAAVWRRLLAAPVPGHIELAQRNIPDQPALSETSGEFALPPIVIEPLAPPTSEEGARP